MGVSMWWKRAGDSSWPGFQKHLDAAVRAGVRGATCHQGSCQSAAARIELGRVRAEQTPCLPTASRGQLHTGASGPGSSGQQGRGLAAHVEEGIQLSSSSTPGFQASL